MPSGTRETNNPDVFRGATPDGRYVMYNKDEKLALHSLAGGPTRDTVLDIPARGARISPDGKWVAYETFDETTAHHFELFVQPFPGPGPRVQVSQPGTRGMEPMWSPDGRRLFYTGDSTVIVADVRTSPTFAVSSRRTLFDNSPFASNSGGGYDVTPDGKHLLKVRTLNDGEAAVVHNWRAEVKRRVAESSGQRK